DALDAAAGENADLLRDLVGRADVEPAADAAVLPFRVLAHADHVDVRGRPSGEWRADAGHQPHRPQVHVLIEPLPDRENELPDSDVVRDRLIADRAEIDRVELLQPLETIVVHHLSVLAVE